MGALGASTHAVNQSVGSSVKRKILGDELSYAKPLRGKANEASDDE
jgi:hypothetical protein